MYDQIPWIVFEAFDYLKGIIRSDMRVFEYGMGGSSFFFASKVRDVVAVEHDQAWFTRVAEHIKTQNINNFQGFFCPPISTKDRAHTEYSDPDSYLSADEKFLNKFSFYNYASFIDRYEDNTFDIVSVDGRARPSCIKHAIPKIKPKGYLMLDNSERQYYVERLSKELSCFEKVFERYGPGPYSTDFWGTTFYRKKDHK